MAYADADPLYPGDPVAEALAKLATGKGVVVHRMHRIHDPQTGTIREVEIWIGDRATWDALPAARRAGWGSGEFPGWAGVILAVSLN